MATMHLFEQKILSVDVGIPILIFVSSSISDHLSVITSSITSYTGLLCLLIAGTSSRVHPEKHEQRWNSKCHEIRERIGNSITDPYTLPIEEKFQYILTDEWNPLTVSFLSNVFTFNAIAMKVANCTLVQLKHISSGT
jgi:hypothetical protein